MNPPACLQQAVGLCVQRFDPLCRYEGRVRKGGDAAGEERAGRDIDIDRGGVGGRRKERSEWYSTLVDIR